MDGPKLGLSTEARERLLDRLPLTDEELDVLMECRQQQRGGGDNLKILSSSWLVVVDGHASGNDKSNSNNSNCGEVLRPLWSWALENATASSSYSTPTSDDDDDDIDEASSSEHAAFIFLEAVCSLLGRRGEAILHRTLFHSQAIQTVDAIAQFLFQLVQLDGQIQHVLEQRQQQQQQSPHEAANGGAEPIQMTTTVPSYSSASAPGAPCNWIASLQTVVRRTTTKDNNKSNNNNGNNGERLLSWSAFHLWITECAPWFHTVVPSLFHFVWFGGGEMEHFRPGHPWSLPQFMIPNDYCNMAFSHSKMEVVAPLGAMLGPGRHLYAIYSSDEQGKHFGTFQQALTGYIGATLTLVGTEKSQILGYYTQAPWMTDAKTGWHGNMVLQDDGSELSNQAFLFTLSPTWQMFPRTYDDITTAGGLQWLKMAHTTRTTMPFSGLAIGGMHPNAPRLLLTETFEQCQAMRTDRTFGSGCLVPTNYNSNTNGKVVVLDEEDEECVLFDVEWIDVYAVVDSHDHANPRAEFQKRLEAGQKVRQTREWHRQKAAHVDKSQFVNDLASGMYGTTCKLYAHREQARGRADFVVADDDRKGYFIATKQPSMTSIISPTTTHGED